MLNLPSLFFNRFIRNYLAWLKVFFDKSTKQFLSLQIKKRSEHPIHLLSLCTYKTLVAWNTWIITQISSQIDKYMIKRICLLLRRENVGNKNIGWKKSRCSWNFSLYLFTLIPKLTKFIFFVMLFYLYTLPGCTHHPGARIRKILQFSKKKYFHIFIEVLRKLSEGWKYCHYFLSYLAKESCNY